MTHRQWGLWGEGNVEVGCRVCEAPGDRGVGTLRWGAAGRDEDEEDSSTISLRTAFSDLSASFSLLRVSTVCFERRSSIDSDERRLLAAANSNRADSSWS